MTSIFRIVEVSECVAFRTDPSKCMRDIVLKTVVPRVGDQGCYAADELIVATLFNEEAQHFMLQPDGIITANLSFRANKGDKGWFNRVYLNRYAVVR